MKLHIVGIERTNGTSKAGKLYDMARLHCITKLAPPMSSGKEKPLHNVAKGAAATTYEVEPQLVLKIEHLPFDGVTPVTVEADIEDVVRFGERQSIVRDLRPVEVNRPQVAPVK